MAVYDYAWHILTIVLIFGLLAQSFNLSFGLGGLVNLAHVASFALGAYITAIGSVSFGLGWLSCMILGAVGGAIAAAITGALATRLSGDYFAIGSLALGSLASAVLINWRSVTNGVLGITGIPRPVVLGSELTENYQFLFFTLSITVLLQAMLMTAFRGHFSRSLRAQAENDPAAQAIGVNTGAVRLAALTAASSAAAVAGSLYAFFINYIDPLSFTLNETILILSIVVAGRPGSFFGVLLSGCAIISLPEALRHVDIPSHLIGPGRQFLNASVLFIFLYLYKAKLFPERRNV